MSSRVIHLADAQAAIPTAAGEHAISLFQRGTLNVKLSKPIPPNRQTPHTQDELYIVVRGRGVLVHNGGRDRFEAGDLMFIAAGTEHHVEDFSNDLTMWVVFYGPPGGEAAT
jgi:mannose-6-phosphate isomerase-like protein (cupin superfamily)